MNNAKRMVALAILALLCAGCATNVATKKPVARKNIIVMISDGCGYAHVNATSYYEYGRTGMQPYEQFPVKCGMSTYPANSRGYDPESAWRSFEYLKNGPTGSAAAATAMATGVKTNNGALGVNPEGERVMNVVESAEARGMATGVITSVQLSHATPAGYVAHNASRNNYVEIAQEMIERSTVDVIMGAGHPYCDNDGKVRSEQPNYKYVGGEALWVALRHGIAGSRVDADHNGRLDDPWVLIEDREDFRRLMSGRTPKRVIGVAQVYGTLQQSRSGMDDNVRDDLPGEVPLIENVPTLVEMTRAALNVLDEDPDGFFLMIEGGAVDWASHVNQSGRMIEEMIDFNRSVDAVVEWVEKNSNWDESVLIITADHECGYLTGPGSNPRRQPVDNRGVGNLPGMEWHSGAHTNSLVPFYAKGMWTSVLNGTAARNPKSPRGPYIDNTDFAKFIFNVIQAP